MPPFLRFEKCLRGALIQLIFQKVRDSEHRQRNKSLDEVHWQGCDGRVMKLDSTQRDGQQFR